MYSNSSLEPWRLTWSPRGSLGALETHYGAFEAHSGAMEAHPGAMELTLEFVGLPWSLEDHFGWRLIQELLGHGAKELTIENGGLLIDLGGSP
jgi:hypothetical protein